jgi:hypothetical protein
MLRIVYNEESIITIIKNTPDMGVTYTTERVIICTKEEALAFFANYPEEDLNRLVEFEV